MNKTILSIFLFQGICQSAIALKCDNFTIFTSTSISSTSIQAVDVGDSVSIAVVELGPLDELKDGGHCFMGQLTYEQFQNLQDERLKAAIIRSLSSNSSWQQR